MTNNERDIMTVQIVANSANLPDGVYSGIYSGYEFQVKDGSVVEVDDGVRGAFSATLTISGNKATIDLGTPADWI